MRNIGPDKRFQLFLCDIDSIIGLVEFCPFIRKNLIVDWFASFGFLADFVFVLSEESLTIEGRNNLVD